MAHVLVVEDSPRLRKYLGIGLERAGFDVDLAQDGRAAMQKMMGFQYEAVVLDLMLPELDGFQVLEGLRARKIATPVLILTARDDLSDRLRGLNSGADDYLVKPFAFEELVARVHSLLRRSYGFGGEEIELGNFRLNLRSRSAWAGSTRLSLTKSEYRLLEFLALNRSAVFSKEELERRLYSHAEAPSSNAIEVGICRLRRKLANHGLDSLIRNKRGLGYVLDWSE